MMSIIRTMCAKWANCGNCILVDLCDALLETFDSLH